jgi:uncharacterized protein YjbI with pentapeptide repeats
MPRRNAEREEEMALFEIKHRFNGVVLFRLKTESLKLCVDAAVKGRAYLGGADLGGADLRDADLRGVYLNGADLRSANLRNANLRSADLRSANLRNANLGGAYLGGADLGGAEGAIDLGSPDGWGAHAWLCDGWLSIRVGCREMRLSEAREYWSNKLDRREVMAALDYAQSVAELRGWAIVAPAEAVAA